MTSAAAAFLTAELLGRVGDFAAILGLGSALTLVVQILNYIKVDCVVVGLDAEHGVVQDNLLSGFRSVDLVN